MRGGILLDTGDKAAALSDFEAATKLDPRKASAYLGISLVEAASGHVAAALDAANTCMSIEPGKWQCLSIHGQLEQTAGDGAAAARDFDASLAVNPDQAEAWDRKANLDEAKGDTKLAVAEASKALVLDPKYVPALVTRGAAYLKAKSGDEAMRDFDADRGMTMVEQGQYAQALPDLRKALALKPSWRDDRAFAAALASAETNVASR